MDNKYSILEKIVVFEFLFFSGSIFLSLSPYKPIFMLIWVISAFLLYKKNKARCDKNNIILLCIVSIWGLINDFVIHTSIGPYSIFELICFGIGSLFVISSMEFNRLRNLLLSELAVLSVVSIVVALLYHLGIIGAVGTNTNRNVAFHFFCVSSKENFRLQSVYWEAGQYQIVLFYILFLFTDKIRIPTDLLKDLRFVIVLFSILLTKSTTGYIVLMLFIGAIILSGESKIYVKALLIPVGLLAISFLLYSPVIQDKFQDDNMSFLIRASDQRISVDFIRENPICGKGLATVQFENAVKSFDFYNSSNGWLTGMVRFGVPLILLLILVMLRNIHRLHSGINFILLFLMLVVSQCNEWYIFFPINYLYFYRIARSDPANT